MRVRAGGGRRCHGGAGDGDGEGGARGTVPPPGRRHPHRRRPLASGVPAHARRLAGVRTLLLSIRSLPVRVLSWVRVGSVFREWDAANLGPLSVGFSCNRVNSA